MTDLLDRVRLLSLHKSHFMAKDEYLSDEALKSLINMVLDEAIKAVELENTFTHLIERQRVYEAIESLKQGGSTGSTEKTP